MTLHLLRGRWWTIVCPPYIVLRSSHRGCIPIAVCSLLPALIYPHRYTRLHTVRLVRQGPRGLPDNVPRADILT